MHCGQASNPQAGCSGVLFKMGIGSLDSGAPSIPAFEFRGLLMVTAVGTAEHGRIIVRGMLRTNGFFWYGELFRANGLPGSR